MVSPNLLASIVLIAVPFVLPAQKRMPQEESTAFIEDRPAPVYPPLAKAARIQGTVRIDVTVSELGSVGSTKLISGHPLLVAAAVDAVKRYRFKPYLIEGRAAQFITTVDITFSLGIPTQHDDSQQAINQEYFKKDKECRDLMKRREWPEAERVCKAAVPLADKLDDADLTKMLAHECVGHVMLAQGQFEEALDYYNHAFSFAQRRLKETDAEMGWAYRDLALANQGLGNLEKARELYTKAEKIILVARDRIELEELKQSYARGLKEIFKYHALAAEQAGAAAEAEDVRRRLAAME